MKLEFTRRITDEVEINIDEIVDRVLDENYEDNIDDVEAHLYSIINNFTDNFEWYLEDQFNIENYSEARVIVNSLEKIYDEIVEKLHAHFGIEVANTIELPDDVYSGSDTYFYNDYDY